jgi:trehalose synthase-fused probable maltokinase
MTPKRTPPRPRAARQAGGPDDLTARAAARLPGLLPAARWFGAKSRTIAGARPLDHAAVPGTAGVLALFEIAYADGGAEVYLVPVIPAPRGAVADATEDPAFCRALLAQIRAAAVLPGQAGAFRFVPTAAFAEALPEIPAEAARLSAEQSNTSVVFGQQAILKLFRKLEAGPNPDVEVGDALTRQGRFRETPRLLGSASYLPAGGESTTLLALQEFVPNQGDAWTGALARLAEYYAVAPEAAEGGPASGAAFARTLAAADAEEARRLGALTGRLHMALAGETADPAFAPEPITPADAAAWIAGMEAQLEQAVAELSAALPGLPEGVREPAQALAQEARALLGGPSALQALVVEPVAKIRLHGDYHLGQVLRTGESFAVLDFEGEPARPLAERRSKQCALKDVAGMLRSFAYAARAALIRAVEDSPETPRLAARLQPWAEAWEEGTRAGFLEGYLEETWQRGAAFLPRTREGLEAALRAFELDKATYELRYELNSRPAWVRIPLEGLRHALAAPREARRPRRAAPFHFAACLELREFTGLRAENERQLAERIEEVPLDSIYYHTHGFFLRHKFVAGAFPNDFATWVAIQVRDRVLSERLAMVDPRQFDHLQALREELASVIYDHLRTLPIDPGVIFGEPFDFVQSRIVEVPTGIEIRSLEEFRDALLTLDLSAIYFHLVEARLRLGRGRNDFAAWLGEGLGLERLAARVQAVDPYASSLERTRATLIQLCDEALAEEATR